MQTKTRRGPSAASIDAARHLAKNPGTEALALAKKFKINITTVYRSMWWKNRDIASVTGAKDAEEGAQ